MERQLEEIFEYEELQWQRRGGVKWILKGDSNNGYFHGVASGSVGGSENRRESPNTRVADKCTQVTKDRKTKNLRKPVLASKVMNPFTRARAPPFIGRRRDFLHPENTLESKEYS
jgi:hypothetical protein